MIARDGSQSLTAVNDQIEPLNSNDHSVSYYHWWPDKDQWVYLQYDFEKPETISKTKVYWFDDGPDGGCRVPDEWEIQYKAGNTWKPVKPASAYPVTKDGWDSVEFDPVKASAVKIRVKLNKEFSSGFTNGLWNKGTKSRWIDGLSRLKSRGSMMLNMRFSSIPGLNVYVVDVGHAGSQESRLKSRG